MQFIRFIETNDHEGETWTFWLQLNGNHIELTELEEFLDAVNEDVYDVPFELRWDVVEEHEVDTLVKYGGQGYMDYQNKVIGWFQMPEIDYDKDLWDQAVDFFYKGGIEDHFKEEK